VKKDAASSLILCPPPHHAGGQGDLCYVSLESKK
jgi:hypothetical protein